MTGLEGDVSRLTASYPAWVGGIGDSRAALSAEVFPPFLFDTALGAKHAQLPPIMVRADPSCARTYPMPSILSTLRDF
jgi:hypothetical protein